MPDYTLTRTGAEIDAIGDILYATSSITSLPNNTYTDLCSLVLPKGKWIVFAQFRMSPGSVDAFVAASLSTTSGDIAVGTAGGLYQGVFAANQGLQTVGLARIVQVPADAGATIYLVARQISGEAKTINGANQIMNAIRIR